MPPAGRYLLDTNILIALLAAEPSVTAALRAAPAVFIPSIALGELFYGAAKSGRPAQNTQAVEALSAVAAVVPCGAETVRRYGELKARLRSRGSPIPENDLWIAAVALEHDLTLVTRDTHFAALPEITTTAWS
jgi:tRNA(fMet)-specific endonuclease VapC